MCLFVGVTSLLVTATEVPLDWEHRAYEALH